MSHSWENASGTLYDSIAFFVRWAFRALLFLLFFAFCLAIACGVLFVLVFVVRYAWHLAS